MKFKFDGQDYPYTSRRRVIYARRGMVCTSQPLSAQAGLAMLQQGGTPLITDIDVNNIAEARRQAERSSACLRASARLFTSMSVIGGVPPCCSMAPTRSLTVVPGWALATAEEAARLLLTLCPVLSAFAFSLSMPLL